MNDYEWCLVIFDGKKIEDAALGRFPNPVQARNGRRMMQVSEYEAKADPCERDRNNLRAETRGAFT